MLACTLGCGDGDVVAMDDESTQPETPTPLLVQEVCNGVDDDGDHLIDEGFPDLDLDGRADCVDLSCDLPTRHTDTVVGSSCSRVAPLDGLWDLEESMFPCSVTSGAEAGAAFSMPVSARQSDGLPGLRGLVWGDYGEAENQGWWIDFEAQTCGAAFTSGLPISALADIDVDGQVDLLRDRYDGGMQASMLERLTPMGAPAWSAPGDPGWNGTHLFDLGDIEGDGSPEIAWRGQVIHLATGEVAFSVPAMPEQTGCPPLFVDIDEDGTSELLDCIGAYGVGGQMKWVSTIIPDGWVYFLPLQTDSDPGPEIVSVRKSGLYIEDHGTGSVTAWAAGVGQPRPPCAADLTDDGIPEVVWASEPDFSQGPTVLQAWTLDGQMLWSKDVQDPTSAAGCSAFDFDGDGRFEVLYQDHEDMWILDGPTGDVRYRWDNLISLTLDEYPYAADLDGDGSAEIVFIVPYQSHWPDPATPGGIAVLSHPQGAWMPGAEAWPSWNYRINDIDPWGVVPAHPDPSWLVHNTFRAAPQRPKSHPDLVPRVVASCAAGCEETNLVRLSLTVINQGSLDVAGPVSLVVRAGITVLTSLELPGPLTVGAESQPIEVTTTVGEVGKAGLTISVDDADSEAFGTWVECDEANNRLTWSLDVCP
jgi:hypothetical protein